MPVEKAYIGIGGNIGDAVTIVTSAIDRLRGLPGCRLLAHSSLYRSEPVSDIAQDDYINAVALIETGLEPKELLIELQGIEKAFHRQRDPALKWAPRTLDLDIILFGHRRCHDRGLTIPHPEMKNRLFVLEPMLEIGGDFDIPGLGSLRELLERAPGIAIERLAGGPGLSGESA